MMKYFNISPGIFFTYYGFGPHIGYNKRIECFLCQFDDIQDSLYISFHDQHATHNVLALGIDIMFGIEYQLNSFPLTLAAEFKPSIEFADTKNTLSDFLDFGISIKYILN